MLPVGHHVLFCGEYSHDAHVESHCPVLGLVERRPDVYIDEA